MKSLIVTAVCIVCMHIGTNVSGQQANRSPVIDNLQSLHMGAGYLNNVHVRAMRDFVKRNNTATHVEWMVADDGYVAKYTGKNNSQCRTVYNCRGNYAYTIRQYDEAHMPRDVRKLIKSVYYDYTINLVEEIELRAKSLIYVVHVQDETTLKNIRVCDGEMEVIEDYQNAAFVQRMAGN